MSQTRPANPDATPAAPQVLGQQLQANLQAQHDCATLLLDVLREEHNALLGSDVERLERITQAKASAAGTLQQLGATMNRLRGGHELEALLARLPTGAVGALWRGLRQLAGQCQDANQSNALLLAARESQLRQTLRALRPADAPELYGRAGRPGLGLAGRRFGAA